MVFTFAILLEKTLSIMEWKPLFLQAEENVEIRRVVRGIPASCDPDILWVMDNRTGKSDGIAILPQVCIYIASPGECEAQTYPQPLPGYSLAVLPPSADPDAILETLQNVFMFYNSWYDNMLKMIRRGDDWYTLLDEGHRVLGNPIILYDRSMKVLAYTRNDHTDDPVWNSTTGSGTIRVGTASEASELLRYITRLDQYTHPFRHEGEGLTNPFYTSIIFSDGVRCGMVTEVEYHHSLSAGDRELLQVFTDLAALKIRTTLDPSAAPDVAGHLLVQDLLNGTITSTEHLVSRLLAAHWEIHRYFRLLIFISPLPFMTDGQWSQTYTDLRHLDLNGIGCLMCREESRLYFLMSTQEEALTWAQLEKIRNFCSTHRLHCGCSNSCEDLLEARRCGAQAEAALTLGREMVNFYSQLRYTQLIRQLQKTEYPQDLIHPAIWKLRETDESTGSEYLHTLRSLMEHLFRQTDAASDLNIHRTTLIYRLNKIQELTGLNLDNPQEMLHAAISLEMLRDLTE